jgi:HD-GYP domain-containing protein (c-di-GMP phosphodiesterase class II)
MALATFVVAVLPVLIVSALSTRGVLSSLWVSAATGATISMGLGAAGNAFWKRYHNTRDLVFSDLLLWGWLRRKWIERRLAVATDLFAAARLQSASDDRLEMLKDLAAALEAGDPYTHGHSRRVTRHAYMIGKMMGLSEDQLAKLRTAAALHDVGKLYTPKEILHKPDRLNDDEYEVIKEHPGKGAEMVAPLNDDDVVAMIRHHHERLDGKGYPERLRGDEIPIGSKIIAVADTFDAITSTRPYRRFRTHKAAITILKNEAGTQLDKQAVDAFLKYYTGRRSIAWWAGLTETPQRVLGWTFESVQGAVVTAAKASLAVAATSVMLNPVMSRAATPNPVVQFVPGEMRTTVTMSWQPAPGVMRTVEAEMAQVSTPPISAEAPAPTDLAAVPADPVALVAEPAPSPSPAPAEQSSNQEPSKRRGKKSSKSKSESKKMSSKEDSAKEEKANYQDLKAKEKLEKD